MTVGGRRHAERPLVVMTNRVAGRIAQLEEALTVLRNAGLTVVEVDLTDPVRLEESLAGAVDATVVAAGGDGTLHVLAHHLRQRGLLADTVLGLLPLGTGNDLARTVGIPLDPATAAGMVLSGRPQPLDLLVDDAGTLALNAVHGGVGGLAANRAGPLKPLLGRWAYPLAAGWAGARAEGWSARVLVDGEVLSEGRLLFVGIGNGRTVGGGTVLWPEARPDDGLADVVVAPAGSTASRLKMARALRRGDPRREDGLVTGRGREVRVEGEALPYVADGDDNGARADASWSVHPSAWRLLVPAA